MQPSPRCGRTSAAALPAIEAARFRIEDIDRFSYAPPRFFLKHTHIFGRASAGTRGRCTLHWGRITPPDCLFR
jgi:hypothetical protein